MTFAIYQKEFVLDQQHNLFQHCHASTILAIPNSSDLLVAFFAGEKEGAGDTAIWIVSQHNGVWEMPRRIIAQSDMPHWNPVLHQDSQTGHILLFYKVGTDVHSWITKFVISKDQGKTWSLPQTLVESDNTPRGPVKNKLIVTQDGAWIAPGSIENELYWDAFVDISYDQGKHWMKYPIPLTHIDPNESIHTELWSGLKENTLWENDISKIAKWDGVIQPTLWESKKDHIHALMRSTRGKIYRSDSHDNGKTWCHSYPTNLPNNNSGIDVVKLPNGHLVLAYNPITANWGIRYPIAISVSKDNGITWSEPLAIEEKQGEFSYPAINYAQGAIHLTYTWNRKNIVYQKIIYQNHSLN
ncbi:sialidase family protein [Conservatibacter flavescens]|uniref:Sialidase domain-containing protein n=1 Tax=Conservatibacter flavescens TaxID=28161 RepID=A0A2M8RZL9_9PAST|nr:exo-alpha-sialidase [Conservatibacter flavescens]PJG84316.1 hypothetical protein CVP05_11950 [Conservatibacter flavescens]